MSIGQHFMVGGEQKQIIFEHFIFYIYFTRKYIGLK